MKNDDTPVRDGPAQETEFTGKRDLKPEVRREDVPAETKIMVPVAVPLLSLFWLATNNWNIHPVLLALKEFLLIAGAILLLVGVFRRHSQVLFGIGIASFSAGVVVSSLRSVDILSVLCFFGPYVFLLPLSFHYILDGKRVNKKVKNVLAILFISFSAIGFSTMCIVIRMEPITNALAALFGSIAIAVLYYILLPLTVIQILFGVSLIRYTVLSDGYGDTGDGITETEEKPVGISPEQGTQDGVTSDCPDIPAQPGEGLPAITSDRDS